MEIRSTETNWPHMGRVERREKLSDQVKTVSTQAIKAHSGSPETGLVEAGIVEAGLVEAGIAEAGIVEARPPNTRIVAAMALRSVKGQMS